MEIVSLNEYPNRERASDLRSKFAARFGGAEPEVVVRVPGRVNLIGEGMFTIHASLSAEFVQSLSLVCMCKSVKISVFQPLV